MFRHDFIQKVKMNPNQKYEKSLYEISRELEKIAHLSELIENSKERQALVKYSWLLTNKSGKKTETVETFNQFLNIFIGQNESVRLRFCPSSYSKTSTIQPFSNGAYLLKKAGLDLHSIDSSIQSSLSDFISSLGSYHNQIYVRSNASPNEYSISFPEYLSSQKQNIQKCFISSDFNEILPLLCKELTKNYFPSFDLKKISSLPDKNYGSFIYEDDNAFEVLKSLKSTLKFDLKSMGVDTYKYQETKEFPIYNPHNNNIKNTIEKKSVSRNLKQKLKEQFQNLGFE